MRKIERIFLMISGNGHFHVAVFNQRQIKLLEKQFDDTDMANILANFYEFDFFQEIIKDKINQNNARLLESLLR